MSATRHHRFLLTGCAGLILIWLVAWLGYRAALDSRQTADKVNAYVAGVDFRRLNGEARARALRELARRVNALSLEERRRFRLGRGWEDWFGAMTEPEKGALIEATLPAGFQQMLLAFEQMPEQNRRVAVDEAVKRLREARASFEREGELPEAADTNGPPVLSEELRDKVVTVGLKSYYRESSAQTKAEVAPLLEEIQRMMESGRFLPRRPRRTEGEGP